MGISRPSVLAVLMLIVISGLVGNCTGRSATVGADGSQRKDGRQAMTRGREIDRDGETVSGGFHQAFLHGIAAADEDHRNGFCELHRRAYRRFAVRQQHLKRKLERPAAYTPSQT